MHQHAIQNELCLLQMATPLPPPVFQGEALLKGLHGACGFSVVLSIMFWQ